MDLRMETSQAVSMLQPFRHPKPGLIVMDKTTQDTANKIFDLFVNKRKDRKVTVISVLNEYAQQVRSKKCDSCIFTYCENIPNKKTKKAESGCGS